MHSMHDGLDRPVTTRADGFDGFLGELPGLGVLCFGDAMLDVEIACSSGRISPEAPVLVFQEGERRARAGGAANVAVNLAALGVRPLLVSPAGDDDEAAELAGLASAAGVAVRLVADPGMSRPTTRKTRFVAGTQQVLRIDRELAAPAGPALAAALVEAARSILPRPDLVVVSDYGKGAVTATTMAAIGALADEADCLVLVDPKGTDWRRYGRVDLIKPNAAELEAFTGMPCDDDAEVEAALALALERCMARALLVTRAARGASLLERGGRPVHLHARAIEVADVCGAGDTNLAVLAATLGLGWGFEEAAAIAQLGSGLAVERHGNAVIGARELAAALPGADACVGRDKLLTGEALRRRLASWRAAGLRIGFTNGCFDLVHPGHVALLEAARAACDRLVVAVNSDASVRRLKGASRPVVTCSDRMAVLAGLASVDVVVAFGEDTPEALIREMRPDVLVKGGDYRPDDIVGADFVRSYGGEVCVTALVEARSTSGIVARVRDHAA